MQIGSIVETVGNFEKIRRMWGFPYPKRGDVLTVCSIIPHSNTDVRKRGIVLLHFEELPDVPGMCDKDINGKPNFIELKLPEFIAEVLCEKPQDVI